MDTSKADNPQKTEKEKEKAYPLRVAFIHPDLGIGGAEQLMVNLALTCQKLGWYVKMYTPAYDPKRAFSQNFSIFSIFYACFALIVQLF